MAEKKTGDAVNIAKQTMVGDLRDLVLALFKDREKTWKEMSEGEQRSVAQQAQFWIQDSVEKACDIIAADGRKVIKGTLEQVTVKDGYKSVIKTAQSDPLRHELVDSAGSIVLMVVSDASEYSEVLEPVETDKDEPELPMEDAA